MRQRLSRAGQGRVIILLALALLARALVPTGWMPVATAHGVRLELCAGQDAAAPAMAGMAHGKKEHGKQALPDHPCAFAGLGLAADSVRAPAIVSSPVVTAPLSAKGWRAVTVGRGLAAPPPPATGPPAFA